MGNKRGKAGRDRWSDIKGGMAFIIPVQLIRQESYRLLSPWAHKLLADLSTQYSGYNNGYLCAAWTLMQHRGWHSRTTLAKACAELEHFRIIERTQQGGRNRPNLFAFSFRRIDRIEGRPLDVGASPKPSDAWQGEFPPFVYVPQRRFVSPPRGLMAREQAQQMDSVSPSNGLKGRH